MGSFVIGCGKLAPMPLCAVAQVRQTAAASGLADPDAVVDHLAGVGVPGHISGPLTHDGLHERGEQVVELELQGVRRPRVGRLGRGGTLRVARHR